ncbi:hypothetical protein F2P81_024637 [Scophthalmus maximus]|uniref:Uncharacterized protein n=1 Tax=Scophthalmus maximus TaxID=52904 RepID=A0A6A4RUI9_SCOMX|nr:hypothetical protein F2P81_024637 [Scophthalmus maximus]
MRFPVNELVTLLQRNDELLSAASRCCDGKRLRMDAAERDTCSSWCRHARPLVTTLPTVQLGSTEVDDWSFSSRDDDRVSVHVDPERHSSISDGCCAC